MNVNLVETIAMMKRLSKSLVKLVLALIFLYGAYSIDANAQPAPPVQLDFPDSGGMTVTVPDEFGLTVSIPSTTGVQIETSCNEIIVTIPAGMLPTITTRPDRVRLKVNARKFDLPISMEPLPLRPKFPSGGKILITRNTLDGVIIHEIIFQGANVTIEPLSVNQAVKLSGQWQSNIGLVYEIVQNGNNFSWTVANTNQTAKGRIEGNNIYVEWSDSKGQGSARGIIKEKDSAGRATRIEWDNGVVFSRQASSSMKSMDIKNE